MISEKRARLEGAGSSDTLPLTQENLVLLQRSISPGGDLNGSESNMATDTKKPPKLTLIQAKQCLQTHRLFVNDTTTKNHRINDLARNVTSQDRHSEMGDEEVQVFATQLEKTEYNNEMDFIAAMWKRIKLEQRTVEKTPIPPEVDEEKLFLESWEKAGLATVRQQLFATGCIPKLDTEGNVIAALIESKLQRVADPAPDRAFGLDEDLFSRPEKDVMDLYPDSTKLSKACYQTFFAVEFKGGAGGATIQEAQLQATRSGAAIVNAMRDFKKEAGQLTKENEEDIGSFAFTMAMNPSEARVYAHWAEMGTDGLMVFHQHMINSFYLVEGKNAPGARRAVNNILDWGVKDRKEYIRGLISKIRAKQEGATEQPKTSQGSKEGSRKSNRIQASKEKKQ